MLAEGLVGLILERCSRRGLRRPPDEEGGKMGTMGREQTGEGHEERNLLPTMPSRIIIYREKIHGRGQTLFFSDRLTLWTLGLGRFLLRSILETQLSVISDQWCASLPESGQATANFALECRWTSRSTGG